MVDLTGAEDKSPAAATDDARRTASSVVEKIEVTDISRRLQGLKKSDLKHEARLLGVQQADLDILCDVDQITLGPQCCWPHFRQSVVVLVTSTSSRSST